MTEDSKPEIAPRFVIRQLGEIEFDGMDGPERINGLVLEANSDEAIRAVGHLFRESVTVCRAAEPVDISETSLLDRVAEAINDARYDTDMWRDRPRPVFADEDRGTREYAYRLAKSALLATTPRPASELVAALRKLANEVGGLRAFEYEVRAAISNTNWEVLMLRLSEAETALAQLSGVAASLPTAGAGVKALEDIAAERRRQVDVEGWTPEHDDGHDKGEMAAAAGTYALVASRRFTDVARQFWPWDFGWWKPCDERRNLVKAGALIVAEIERLDRAGRTALKEGQG